MDVLLCGASFLTSPHTMDTNTRSPAHVQYTHVKYIRIYIHIHAYTYRRTASTSPWKTCALKRGYSSNWCPDCTPPSPRTYSGGMWSVNTIADKCADIFTDMAPTYRVQSHTEPRTLACTHTSLLRNDTHISIDTRIMLYMPPCCTDTSKMLLARGPPPPGSGRRSWEPFLRGRRTCTSPFFSSSGLSPSSSPTCLPPRTNSTLRYGYGCDCGCEWACLVCMSWSLYVYVSP